MGIGSVFGKVGGFLKGLLPNILKLSEAFELLLTIFKVGISDGDKAKLEQVTVEGRELTSALRSMADELDDVWAELDRALGDAGDGGSDLTGKELQALVAEADDLPGAAAAIGDNLTDLIGRLRRLA